MAALANAVRNKRRFLALGVQCGQNDDPLHGFSVEHMRLRGTMYYHFATSLPRAAPLQSGGTIWNSMRRSTDRILVSHAGTVPRPADLQELYEAGPDEHATSSCACCRKPSPKSFATQLEVGIDIVNDGELSKLNFSHYARERLGGLEQPSQPLRRHRSRNIVGRDAREFPEFHSTGGGRVAPRGWRLHGRRGMSTRRWCVRAR